MANISRSDIQEVYGEKSPALSSTKQTALKDIAERLTENNYGGKVATQPEIEGDTDDFARYLGAHLWALAERNTLNEEFQTGNSGDAAPPNTVNDDFLGQTVYGSVCQGMLRSQGASTSVVRSYF